jgi:C4-dicarboxylate-specific signal transduction histidine kinase
MTDLAANALIAPSAVLGPRDERGCTSTKVVSVSIGLITLGYVLYYVGQGLWGEALANLPLVVAAALAFLFVRRRKSRLAAHTILLACNLAVFVGKSRYGEAVHVENYYWTTAALGILLFLPRHPRDALFAIAQPPFFMLLARHVPIHMLGEVASLPDETLRSINQWTHSAPFNALFMALVIHIVGERRHQARINEANRGIEREHARARLLRDVALIANEAQGLMSALQQAAPLLAAALSGDTWSVELPAALPKPAPRVVTFETRQGMRRLLVPIVAGAPAERVVAAIVVAGRQLEAPDADRRADLASIARQLSLVAERLHAQDELARTHAKMITSAKMAALGVMAGGIAHEINNPLAVLQGYAARIRRAIGEPDASQRIDEAVSHVNDTIARISRIVAGLRAFARDSAADPIESSSVAAILADTLALSSERLRSRGVVLDVRPVEAGLRCDCRATQICQVLINLLNNAFDAVEAAPPRPDGKRIAVHAEADGAWVCFEVRDNGPGIPAAIRERLFEPFFTTKPVGRGTGLGLSISKGIVESHGGTLAVESGEWGSAFVVRLPRH